jgi:hypothetical protein
VRRLGWVPSREDLGAWGTFVGVASGLAGLGQFLWPDLPTVITPAAGIASLLFGGLVLFVSQHRGGRLEAVSLDQAWSIEIGLGDLFRGRTIVVTVDQNWSVDVAAAGGDSLVGQLLQRTSATSRADIEKALVERAASKTWPGATMLVRPQPEAGAFEDVILLAVGMPTLSGTETVWQHLWLSYDGLWEAVRSRNVSELTCPVIGAGFSNSRLSHAAVLQTLLLSFHAASVDRPVCRRLALVLDPTVNARTELAHVRTLLRGLGYSVSRVP